MGLTRIDKLGAPLASGMVFAPVRDEMFYLPSFLTHYRDLGVKRFLIVDNQSSDGTTDYLLQQEDCIVYYADESFRAANSGLAWLHAILDDKFSGWLLYSDADEHMAFREMDNGGVAALLARMESAGADTLYAAMIDMYPADDFLSPGANTGKIGVERSVHFDAHYVFRDWPLPPWSKRGEGFLLQVLGGPRCRLLSSLARERRRSYLEYFVLGKADHVIRRAPAETLEVLAKLLPKELPAQQKMPVNYVRPGFRFRTSHTSGNTKYHAETAAMLHYKFCEELVRRIQSSAQHMQYYRRGVPYIQLRQKVEKMPLGARSLLYEGSRTFRSWRDLAQVGLIGPTVAQLWTNPAAKIVATG